MSATRLLQIDLTRGFDMCPGFVTVPIIGGTSGDKETAEVKFVKLCDLLKEQETGKRVSDKFRIAVVQAILFSMKHKKSCHGDTQVGIYISEDRSTVNIPRPAGAGSTSLKRLSDTFKFILSKSIISDDTRTIADDFYEQAKNGNLTVDAALNHPIFWTAAQKIWYFKRSLYTEKKKAGSLTAMTMTGGNWIKKLSISDDVELINLRNSFRPKDGENLSIEKDTVTELANAKTWCNYDGDSWKDFLAFFRNIHAHFWQQQRNVLHCFRSNDHDGYWDFFSKRFPGLFMKVYENYKHTTNFLTGIEP